MKKPFSIRHTLLLINREESMGACVFPTACASQISTRTAKVTIVEGTSTSQTIVVFVNRAVTSETIPDGTLVSYAPATSSNTFKVAWHDLWEVILGSNQRNRFRSPTGTAAY